MGPSELSEHGTAESTFVLLWTETERNPSPNLREAGFHNTVTRKTLLNSIFRTINTLIAPKPSIDTEKMAGSTIFESSSTNLSFDSVEVDAARALLSVSPIDPEPKTPCSTTKSPVSLHHESSSSSSSQIRKHGFVVHPSVCMIRQTKVADKGEQQSQTSVMMIQRRPRSGSEGLDCLAALADKAPRHVPEQLQQDIPSVSSSSCNNSCHSYDSEDSEAMPPPPPRQRGGRPRSVSNPEDMDSYVSASRRQHFMLPASVLEEELREARFAILQYKSIPEESEYLTPEELIDRARQQLMLDLAEGSVGSEKSSVLQPLPHSLEKYKNIYNQNGRVGIYTPRERAAILARFHRKRSQRNWNKKVRYNCRKNLADSRVRVKGRFVKRAEQEELLLASRIVQTNDDNNDTSTATMTITTTKSADTNDENSNDDKPIVEADMPDVNDPEAGFAPTEDQPYRRLRRHTIT